MLCLVIQLSKQNVPEAYIFTEKMIAETIEYIKPKLHVSIFQRLGYAINYEKFIISFDLCLNVKQLPNQRDL